MLVVKNDESLWYLVIVRVGIRFWEHKTMFFVSFVVKTKGCTVPAGTAHRARGVRKRVKITFTYLQRAASVGGTPPELAGGGRVRYAPAQVTLRCTCGSLDMLSRYTSKAYAQFAKKKTSHLSPCKVSFSQSMLRSML